MSEQIEKDLLNKTIENSESLTLIYDNVDILDEVDFDHEKLAIELLENEDPEYLELLLFKKPHQMILNKVVIKGIRRLESLYSVKSEMIDLKLKLIEELRNNGYSYKF